MATSASKSGRLSLRAEARELELAEPFAIARGRWTHTTNVFVIASYRGFYGLGESSPDSHSGESVAETLAQISSLDAGDRSPFDLEWVREALPPGSTRAAVDIALHDLAAQVAGLSLREFLGLAGRPAPPTSFTVSIGAPEAMAARARALREVPILKLKVGFDGDVDAVAAVREAYGGKLRIDANEGWSAQDASARLEELARYDIELCEQPIPSARHEELAGISGGSPIPIFADEDVCTARDVARLAGVCHGVNLKLRKCGGIREMLAAVATARAEGLGVMIGCDLESGAAASAGAHLASLFDHVDLDGPTLLASDPCPGVSYRNANLELPDAHGTGVDRSAFVQEAP